MPYPTFTPVNKHDLIHSSNISISELSPTLDPSTLILEAISNLASGSSNAITSTSTTTDAPTKIPDSTSTRSVFHKFATIYTFQDAPKHPKPMSASLNIQGFCTWKSLGLTAQYSLHSSEVPFQRSGGDRRMTKCHMAVKRADGDYPKKLHMKQKDIENSNNFAFLCRRLRNHEKVAFFLCPKTQRGGFLIPMEESGEGCDYAAYCWVAPLQDLNHLLSVDNEKQNGQKSFQDTELWKPPTTMGEEEQASIFQSSSSSSSSSKSKPNPNPTGRDEIKKSLDLWQPSTPPIDQSFDFYTPTVRVEEATSFPTVMTNQMMSDDGNVEDKFHTDKGAAAADAFYSNLTRSLDTRADSKLYHMRNFNGWVKATQISELDPMTIDSPTTATHSASKKRKRSNHPLRVLDLACGKGGDLGKWVLHKRGIANYVGIDVARGSLLDAALRARKMKHQLKQCVFTCADLGSDVPGRIKSNKHKRMQKLSSWSLKNDDPLQNPSFEFVRGGGISETDKFDVVSIQFAIHYMMSSIKRARRFFHTVSQLLEVGGNLIATTIDARIVLEHMMNTGYNFHLSNHNDGHVGNVDEYLTISVGNDACQLKFHRNIVEKIFHADGKDGSCLVPDLFGLEYTFTLVEGQDHDMGVGQAVDLPEWLTPLPVLIALAEEAGLVLEYASNFHDFYDQRKDPMTYHMSHSALYNMKVLNRSGTISKQEWEISRMYMAVKFRKERESMIIVDDDDYNDDYDEIDEHSDKEQTIEPKTEQDVHGKTTSESTAENQQEEIDMKNPKVAKMYMIAMSKAKTMSGEEWQRLDSKQRTKMANRVFFDMMKNRGRTP
jgi:mRNA (guanine-N7-)-methyltransferase